MAASVVSGVMTRIGDLLVQEGKFLSEVCNEVELLQTELKLMQSLLKAADTRQDESDHVRQWVAEIKDLAYDAEDIIATYALEVASRKGGGVQKALKRCAGILGEGITVHQVGSQIKDIKMKISNLKMIFQEYGTRESTMQVGGPSSNEAKQKERQTFSHLEHDVVGFDNDLNNLVDFLLKKERDNRVAWICGMGGLGKTTLAKMVYNHHQVKQYFNHRAWVYISQQCQKRLIWEEILVSLLSPLSQMERDKIQKLTDEEVCNKLCKVQREKKCLVILDGIWNINAWNSLRGAFLEEDTSSKILLTSRNKEVSLHVDRESFLYELQHLNDARSLDLLEKMAVSREKDFVTKTYMEKFGKKMIGYCGGLPLAITTLGGLLATKQTQGEWEDVLQRVESNIYVHDNLRVDKVLAISYNDLPCHLKPCFLYLAHFPEDFEIPTKELIRMWMGEGFLSQTQRGGGSDIMDNVGDQYLQELVQRCMVQVGEKGSLGRIKTCRMHELMRKFCISKAEEENFLHITDILSMKQCETQIGKVRRLAIISESGDDSFEEIKFNEYPYLRSLLHLLSRHDHSYFSESCFKKFKLVRVLHLENFKKRNIKLSKDIGCLIHLRYLSLKESHINNVPSSIGNLRCLETLDLRTCFSVQRVPNVFKYMKQLKHLYFPTEYGVGVNLELANLCYLQTLVNVQPKTIQIPTWFKPKHLRVLKVNTNKRAQDVLQMLISRCPNVKKLNLCNRIEKLPEVHQFSQNLAKLSLRETNLEEDPMATLEKLLNLKILRFIGTVFNGKNMVCAKKGFPLLQSLVFSELYNLEEWRVEKGAMTCLYHLQIEYCRRLKMIPDGLKFITTLQELEIKCMPKSFKESLDKGGPDFDKVNHVRSLVFQNCDEE
ncbi:putative disease resistance protein At1g50180 [Castanea sativa]|uniref:putative disease resistance protein At1g50180 n=1 Tax=Castanea sativa TaxID=21020 RepID=UPI003F652526